MASYAKKMNAVRRPRAKASAVPAGLRAPSTRKSYTKQSLSENPALFGGISFGNTGLDETPSIIGMAKGAR